VQETVLFGNALTQSALGANDQRVLMTLRFKSVAEGARADGWMDDGRVGGQMALWMDG